MNKKIWVKLFKIKNKYYCYDVESNNIMEVTKLLYDVLKVYNYSNGEKVIDDFKVSHPGANALEAINIIDGFRKNNGGFGLEREVKLSFPFSKSEYDRALNNLVNHMVLNLTEDCNFACRYCKYSQKFDRGTENPKSMTIDTAKRAVDFLINNSTYLQDKTDMEFVLGFYGGEPLLEQQIIFDTLDYLEKVYPVVYPRFRFSITTNGTLLTEEIVKKLIKYNFTLLISFDGPKDLHDRYRVFKNERGTHDLVAEKIEMIRNLDEDYFKRKVGFSIVMSPEFNFTRVAEYFKYKYFGENRVYLFSIVNAGETDFFDNFNMSAEWKAFRRDEKKLVKRYRDAKVNGKDEFILSNLFNRPIADVHKRSLSPLTDTIFPNGICFPGLQKIFVDKDGTFHFCEKVNRSFNIGNIDAGFDVDKIFFLIDEYIKTTEHCKGCWAVRFCTECFLSAIKVDEFSRDEKKEKCKNKRKVILKNIKEYLTIMEQNPKAFDSETKETEPVINEVFKFLEKV